MPWQKQSDMSKLFNLRVVREQEKFQNIITTIPINMNETTYLTIDYRANTDIARYCY